MRVAAPLLFAAFACASPVLRAQTPDRFSAYEHCGFAAGPVLVEDTPLAQGVEGRTVKTVMGAKNIPLSGGTRLMYAWPGTEPFANVKVEEIPAEDYKQARFDLTDNFQQILTADDSSQRNYALKPRLNGFEIYGLDRKKLEGGVLGIYIFFNEPAHIITTIYFLNQEASRRRFGSLKEYAALRDAFLDIFTGCAAGRAPAAPAVRLPDAPAPAALTRPTTPAVEATTPAAPTPDLPPVPQPTRPAISPAARPPAAAERAAPQAPTPSIPGPATAALPDTSAPAHTVAPAPTGATAATNNDPYIPPEAAPLVHPRNAADRKADTSKAKTTTKPSNASKKTRPTKPTVTKPTGNN